MRCGCLGLATGLPGDHRTAWIDLPLREVLGHDPPDLHRVCPPDIVVSDPRVVKKHNAKLIKLLQESKTDHKAATLRTMVQSNVESPHSIADIDALHFKINQERRELGLKAAKGLRKRHTGGTPLLPKNSAIAHSCHALVQSCLLQNQQVHRLPPNAKAHETTGHHRCFSDDPGGSQATTN